MSKTFYDLVRVQTATTGTGNITLGAAVAGFIAFTGNGSAGIADGTIVSYGIEDGNNRETGFGLISASGTTLTRTVKTSTNWNNLNARFDPINLSGSAQVFITALASDLNKLEVGTDMLPQVAYGFIELYIGGAWSFQLASVVVYDNTGTSHTPTSVSSAGTVETLPWTTSPGGGYVSVVLAFSTPIIPSEVGIGVLGNTGLPPIVVSGSNDNYNWSPLGSLPVANTSDVQVLPLTYPVTNYAAHIGDLLDVKLGALTDHDMLSWNATDKRWENIAGAVSIAACSDVDVTTAAPINGQVLTYSGTTKKWVPSTPASSGGGSGGSGLTGAIAVAAPTAAAASGTLDISALYNAVPPMTGDNAPSAYIASASSEYSGRSAYQVFNSGPQTSGVSGGSGWLTNSTSTGWVQIQLPAAVVVSAYEVMGWSNDTWSARVPTAWTLQGSNDGSTWTTLDTQSSITGWTQWQTNIYFIAANTVAYTYYRLNITANNGDSFMGVSQLKLMTPTPQDTTIPSLYISDQYNHYWGLPLSLVGSTVVSTSSGGGSGGSGTSLTITAAGGSYNSEAVTGFVSTQRLSGGIGGLSPATVGSNSFEAICTYGSTLEVQISNGTSNAISGITSLTIPGLSGSGSIGSGTFALSSVGTTETFNADGGYWTFVWVITGTITSGTVVVA